MWEGAGMTALVRRPVNTGQFGEIVLQFAALRNSVQRAMDCADVQLCEIAAGRLQSLRNLHGYLALRASGAGSLHRTLTHLGLDSLGNSEPHVLATVNAVLANLYLLNGGIPEDEPLFDLAGEFDTGPALLQRNSDRLFGPAPGGRRARIMVTLPDAASDDTALLSSLLEGGMDCARINCAYGDQDSWARTIDRLRQAQSVTGRPCRLFMDLRGPKLRTGPMASEPATLKIRPHRAPNGRVLRPAHIQLVGAGETHRVEEGADACLALDADWLQRLAVGDKIRLHDARGSRRTWRVVDRRAAGLVVESRKTCYLANGTVLTPYPAEGRDRPSTTIDGLPPQPTRLEIRPGDTVRLHRGSEPGEPAVRDEAERLLRPGSMSLDIDEVFRDARIGEPVGFDDGRISGVIEQADSETITVRIRHTRRPVERLEGGKGINLPETALDLPALSEEDLRDLAFVASRADIIGLSFANEAADVRALSGLLRQLGQEERGVIFKIETRRGCANLPAILIEAMRLPNFGVMIARGDLAAECGFEPLAELQEDILRLCEAAHAPVVWATGVLEGLARRGHPVRAEITDAAAAQRAECVMLGKGRYIGRALHVLEELLTRLQDRQDKQRCRLGELRLHPREDPEPSMPTSPETESPHPY
jgi:pyruvate kinase